MRCSLQYLLLKQRTLLFNLGLLLIFAFSLFTGIVKFDLRKDNLPSPEQIVNMINQLNRSRAKVLDTLQVLSREENSRQADRQIRPPGVTLSGPKGRPNHQSPAGQDRKPEHSNRLGDSREAVSYREDSQARLQQNQEGEVADSWAEGGDNRAEGGRAGSQDREPAHEQVDTDDRDPKLGEDRDPSRLGAADPKPESDSLDNGNKRTELPVLPVLPVRVLEMDSDFPNNITAIACVQSIPLLSTYTTKICVKTGGDMISEEILRVRVWERDHVESVMAAMGGNRGATFIDLGANLGMFSLAVAAMHQPVLAVEAVHQNHFYIRKSLEESGTRSFVKLLYNAVSDGYETLYPCLENLKNEGSTNLLTRETMLKNETGNWHLVGPPVDSVLLQDILLLSNSTEIVMKIDVETMECRVLRDIDTINNQTGKLILYIFIEWYYMSKNTNNNCPQDVYDGFVRKLYTGGYEAFHPVSFKPVTISHLKDHHDLVWVHRKATPLKDLGKDISVKEDKVKRIKGEERVSVEVGEVEKRGAAHTAEKGGVVQTAERGGAVETAERGGAVQTAERGGAAQTSERKGSVETEDMGGGVETAERVAYSQEIGPL